MVILSASCVQGIIIPTSKELTACFSERHCSIITSPFLLISVNNLSLIEIYLTGTEEDNEVFGYQEAWAEYRYNPDRVSGQMRSNVSGSLDVWHLADNYSQQPILSADWIKEDKSNLDRVLTVNSSVSNQFWANILIENECTRVMPLYSIPGLVDHH